jgi:L-ascorbate metabolism protein UlaG (beta-lactamase superfamily)
MSSPLTFEWLGCTTFRVRVGGRTLFFDTYVDKAPGVPGVGITSDTVDEADFIFVSHAHFDHVLGADVIARNTGATLIGSYETARLMRANGVGDAQIVPVSGGETVDCGGDMRVYPSLHSCLFAAGSPDSAIACLGDLGISAQDRLKHVDGLFDLIAGIKGDVGDFFHDADPHCSHHDGGQLAYLLETPEGSILINASSGHWTGLLDRLRPDVAVLAASGRPNVDGEPYQGSIADFLVGQVELLQTPKVLLCHHDALLPPVAPALDIGEAVASIKRRADYAQYIALEQAEPVALLGSGPLPG